MGPTSGGRQGDANAAAGLWLVLRRQWGKSGSGGPPPVIDVKVPNRRSPPAERHHLLLILPFGLRAILKHTYRRGSVPLPERLREWLRRPIARRGARRVCYLTPPVAMRRCRADSREFARGKAVLRRWCRDAGTASPLIDRGRYRSGVGLGSAAGRAGVGRG